MGIQELATSFGGPRLVAGYSDGVVGVWEIESRRRIGAFPSVFGFGGRRLAIDGTGACVVAAAYTRGGIAAYDAGTGRQVWRVRGLGAIDSVRFSSDSKALFCALGKGSLHILDATTGLVLSSQLSGVRSIWEDERGTRQVREVARGRGYELLTVNTRTVARVTNGTGSVFDVAFSVGMVCIADGLVRCMDFETGAEQWRYESPPGWHVLRLAPAHLDGAFLGVEFCYSDVHQPERLVYLSNGPSQATQIAATPRAMDRGFVGRGRYLITTNGAVIDTRSGEAAEPFLFE